MLELLKTFKGNEIITLGGIGLPIIPKKPKVYCTGTSKEFVSKCIENTSAEPRLYGIVGPIIGVSGLLLGLAKRQKMNAVSFLAETYGHPMYLGIRGAREIVKLLNSKFSMGINIKELDYEIRELEEEAAKNSRMLGMQKSTRGMLGKRGQDATYIG